MSTLSFFINGVEYLFHKVCEEFLSTVGCPLSKKHLFISCTSLNWHHSQIMNDDVVESVCVCV